MDTRGDLPFYLCMRPQQRNSLRCEIPRLSSSHLLVALLLAQPACSAFGQPINASDQFLWRDARELTVEGKGWINAKDFYDRLPARAEALVRPPVWRLSQDSAGLSVRFVADGTNIAARWTLRRESLAMPHMPASGVSGSDLYVKEKGGWHWLGAGRPEKSRTNEAVLVRGLAPRKREFALYLPLYNGVHKVNIGVAGGNVFEPAAPPPEKVKPIAFYGTSIVQGGCASRPGMAYPAILGRRLDWPTVNLGFSGNAHSEPEVARLIAELHAAVYVLDPLPNMTADAVAARLEPFVTTLRQAQPGTPIILVESLEFPASEILAETRERVNEKNKQLREIYQRLTKAGQKRIFYVPAGKLIGTDGEATVDGVHPTDLGFVRMADALTPVLRRAVKTGR